MRAYGLANVTFEQSWWAGEASFWATTVLDMASFNILFIVLLMWVGTRSLHLLPFLWLSRGGITPFGLVFIDINLRSSKPQNLVLSNTCRLMQHRIRWAVPFHRLFDIVLAVRLNVLVKLLFRSTVAQQVQCIT